MFYNWIKRAYQGKLDMKAAQLSLQEQAAHAQGNQYNQ